MFCNCTLPYLNPKACENCSARQQFDDQQDVDWKKYLEDFNPDDYKYNPPKNIKKTIRTIEKYGPDGEYLRKEVITDEEILPSFDSFDYIESGETPGNINFTTCMAN